MAGVPESEQFRDGKPTLAYANEMPKTFASMTNEQVLHFAELGIPEACRECIVRDVMVVDQVEYEEVCCLFPFPGDHFDDEIFLSHIFVNYFCKYYEGYEGVQRNCSNKS